MKGQIWETRPLESWAKAKELRAKFQKAIADEGPTIIGQGQTHPVDWQVCFRNLRTIEDNPEGAMIQSKNSPFARKSRLASEIRGWGREICGYHGTCWGGQFLGYQMDGSPFPKRHFVIPMNDPCNQHTKRGAQCRDFDNVPMWNGEYCYYLGDWDPDRDIALNDQKTFWYLKMFNDMERIFGQKFDDEKLVEMITTAQQYQQYVSDVSRLMMHVPAPLSVKDLYSFFTLGGLTKLDPEETLAFWRDFRDEVQWRADNNIAAVGNERYRWAEAHPPAWHFLKYYRYMEKYGAVCIGSWYTHGNAGAHWEFKPDGSIDHRDVVRYPADMPVKTREDAIRLMNGPAVREPTYFKMDEYNRPYSLNEFAKVFKCDGAVLALWRAGVGCTMTRKEQGLRLSEEGFRVLHYEGSQPGDRTDLDEKRFLNQLDMWMESQGLEKLDDD